MYCLILLLVILYCLILLLVILYILHINENVLFPHQIPPLKILFFGSGYRSNLSVSRAFYNVSTEHSTIKLKEVGLPCRNITMFIPGFVKKGQMFQTFECGE